MSIFGNSGSQPASLTLGEGLKKVKLTATSDSLELTNLHGTVFTLAPLAKSASAFRDEIIGSVDMAGDLTVTDIFRLVLKLSVPKTNFKIG